MEQGSIDAHKGNAHKATLYSGTSLAVVHETVQEEAFKASQVIFRESKPGDIFHMIGSYTGECQEPGVQAIHPLRRPCWEPGVQA